ncbi:MAG TPA: universal stress protein [Candidatus Dormibacteraeota bacterium]
MKSEEFRRILVAVDASPQSRNAVEVIADLAPRGAQVKLVHVWNLEVRAVRGFWDVETRSEAEELVEGYAERLAEAGLEAGTEIRTGTRGQIYTQIIEAADQFAADLVAMGSRGRSDLGGLFLGSVSHDVVSHTERPVLIVRAAPHPGRAVRRILLAIAGGDEVPSAVATTIAVGRRWDAEVVVVHVARILVVESTAWVEPEAEGLAAVDPVVDQLKSAGVRARGQVITAYGSVANQIAEAAEKWDADLVVMGSRRTGELGALLTGATDHALVHSIQTPVLIAGRGKEA